MSELLTRFSTFRRVEHFIQMIVFTVLVLTGLPQKFPEARLSHGITWLFGGLYVMRWVHRIMGFTMAAQVVIHMTIALVDIVGGKREALSLVPRGKDFQDAVQQLRWYLGLAEHPADFDRYDYRQKFEYWGVAVGGILMSVTGFILFFPVQVANFLPGEVIPASKLAHGSEGFMAFLVIAIWHIYNAHLNPDVFPFDTSIFTGKISRERMHHEHPLELERWEKQGLVPPSEHGHGHAPKESAPVG